MGYGLAGVFTTLVVFMLIIRLIVRLFPHKKIVEEDSYHYDQ